MNDTIYRRDAIQALIDTEEIKGFAYRMLEDRLMEIPSADQQQVDGAALISAMSLGYSYGIKANRPQGEWIPCSERLPKIGEYHISEPCIVYCKGGAYAFAELEENIFGQVGWNCERDDDYHEPIGEVLAWMPLPKPWKGADDGEDIQSADE